MAVREKIVRHEMTIESVPHTAPTWRWIIVDPCAFGRAGLKAAFPVCRSLGADSSLGVASLSAARQALPVSTWVDGELRGCLVVRLPAEPRSALAMLLELATPGMQAAFANWVTVLLTSAPVRRVRWLLAVMSGNLAVRVMDGRLPVAELQHSVLATCCAPTCLSSEDAYHGAVLSKRERRVLLFTLQGVAIAEVARRCAVSHKTLYNQRHTALLKLGVRGVRGLLCLFGEAAVKVTMATVDGGWEDGMSTSRGWDM